VQINLRRVKLLNQNSKREVVDIDTLLCGVVVPLRQWQMTLEHWTLLLGCQPLLNQWVVGVVAPDTTFPTSNITLFLWYASSWKNVITTFNRRIELQF